MAGIPTKPRMHEAALPPRRGSVDADACFRADARKRKLPNPNMHGNVEAELCRTGKARIRLPDSVESRSEEHTSELQSLMRISYAVFCLKKKNQKHKTT